MVKMNDEVKTEFLKVKDLISEEDYIKRCDKLSRKLGFVPTEIYNNEFYNVYKESKDRLYLHNLNHFPLKAIFEYEFDDPLKKQDIAKILSQSLKFDIDLINTDNYAVIYDGEKIFGDSVKFIKKSEIHKKDLIEYFKECQIEYVLKYCEDESILNKLNKSFTDFKNSDELIDYLKKYKDEFKSLKWSIKYYNKYKEEYKSVKETYSMITEFQFFYQFVYDQTPLESCIPDEFAEEHMADHFTFYKEYKDSYDFWNQYGTGFAHV